jgi:hypothetical protein
LNETAFGGSSSLRFLLRDAPGDSVWYAMA